MKTNVKNQPKVPMKFKYIMDECGLSINQMAKLLAISRTAAHNYYNRKRDVPLRHAIILLKLGKNKLSEEKKELLKFLEGLLAER